jgi:CRISPR-associated protein Csm4
MKTYVLRVQPKSSFLTPWQADTIFGSLCWCLAWREGSESVLDLLNAYRRGEPPFVLSDGFPGDYLPAPAHLPLQMPKGQGFGGYKEAKRAKKISWLTLNTFDSLRRTGTLTSVPDEIINPFREFTTLHSSINRNSGTTGDEGSLFEMEEYEMRAGKDTQASLSVYLKVASGWEDKVVSLFTDLSLRGYGKKASVGKGAFSVEGELEPFNSFGEFDGANAFISLSNFVPGQADPTNGFYSKSVKYGRLGGEFTFSGKPFKKPLVTIDCGAVFVVNGSIAPFYGRMVDGIAPIKPEVVQYGYAFSVPARVNG